MRPEEAARLAEIDRAADRLFLETGIPEAVAMVSGQPAPVADFNRMLGACHVLVACSSDDQPVGLAAIQPLDGGCWLRLLAVDPDHGRRGIGSELLRETIRHGRSIGASQCGLSTFRDIAFNQPFYEAMGFREQTLSEATSSQRDRFEAEVPEEARPDQRVLMVIDL